MTTESTQPQPEQGPAPDNGQVQSRGHRRRRRRRKNKSNQQAGMQGQAMQGQAQPQMQSQPPAQPANAQQHHHHNQGQGRKKKKFFQKNSQPGQPGNSISGQGQGRRKGRQKGPRMFVGPMDHSYRAVNGNVADGPPSTIPTSGNGHGSYYPEVHAPAAPVRQNAPTRIYCFIEDLFFLAKIQETARKLGVKVEFVKGEKEQVAVNFHDASARSAHGTGMRACTGRSERLIATRARSSFWRQAHATRFWKLGLSGQPVRSHRLHWPS
jgi:hypothetical protein